MGFSFTPAPTPFPRWMGPYSPARGVKTWSGFRFHRSTLGVWVRAADSLLEFWQIERSSGVTAVEALVRGAWGHGRVLFMPDGRIIKPDPSGDGTRYFIGTIQGSIVLVRPDGTRFDVSASQGLAPGDPWPGPGTTGIECKIDHAGRITCNWGLPVPLGTVRQEVQFWGADAALAAGLRAARPGATEARVRVQTGGVVITNKHGNDELDPVWAPHYIGRIDVSCLPFDTSWIVN